MRNTSRILFLVGLLVLCTTIYAASHVWIGPGLILAGKIIGIALMLVGAAMLWPAVSQTIFNKHT